MRDVTPKAMRCWPLSCPAIFEVTPSDMRCAMTMSCPAVFEKEDGYLIIGKIVEVPEEIFSRVGEGETVVWVPKGLVVPAPEDA